MSAYNASPMPGALRLPGLQAHSVGRIRHLCRHPARNAGGAALARPTMHTPIGRIRCLRRHPAWIAGAAALARPTSTLP
ncbi:hypothetical protein EH164_21260 [Kosakonia sp. CCTCC M2018092]|nr:hypothetical protein EH164_21260 [Kosakonia sp. CCTCC M2018092]